VIKGNGSADNIRAGGAYSPRKKAEDMTAPTTSATPKITLDQRAPSRHDKALNSVSLREGTDWNRPEADIFRRVPEPFIGCR
jgi:hypothetical protein